MSNYVSFIHFVRIIRNKYKNNDETMMLWNEYGYADDLIFGELDEFWL